MDNNQRALFDSKRAFEANTHSAFVIALTKGLGVIVSRTVGRMAGNALHIYDVEKLGETCFRFGQGRDTWQVVFARTPWLSNLTFKALTIPARTTLTAGSC